MLLQTARRRSASFSMDGLTQKPPGTSGTPPKRSKMQRSDCVRHSSRDRRQRRMEMKDTNWGERDRETGTGRERERGLLCSETSEILQTAYFGIMLCCRHGTGPVCFGAVCWPCLNRRVFSVSCLLVCSWPPLLVSQLCSIESLVGLSCLLWLVVNRPGQQDTSEAPPRPRCSCWLHKALHNQSGETFWKR